MNGSATSTAPVPEHGGTSTATATAGDLPALHVQQVSKSFNGITVLQPLDLVIGPGEVHMLLGQNGSGKSTFIKVLSGYHVPDLPDARCLVAGREVAFGSAASSNAAGLRFVHQDLGLVDTESVADNLLIGQRYPTRLRTIRPRMLRATATAALDRVGLDLDPRTKVADLSPAQRTGVAIARALYGWERSCEVIVLDEPTATLPAEEVEHLHAILRTVTATGVGALYVTHDLSEVAEVGQRVSILRDGRLVASAAVGELDHGAMVHALVGKEVEAVQRQAHDQHREIETAPLLTVSGLRSERVQDVSFTAGRGEVLGFYGLTGSGRESILSAIFGAVQRTGGRVRVGDREIAPFSPVDAVEAGMAYVPSNRKTHGGFMLLTATDNLSITDLSSISGFAGTIIRRRERKAVERWFTELDVRPAEGHEEPLSTFSGGNQQKIVMAKWLRREPAVLLLNEPTQGVDVGAKAQLHRHVLRAAAAGTTVLVSSSDVQELATLCTRVVVMRQGRIAVELTGDEVTENAINEATHGNTPDHSPDHGHN